MLLRPAGQTRIDRGLFSTRRFGCETGTGARYQCQSPAHLDDQTSASVVGGRFATAIKLNASFVYSGGSGQRPSFADHVAGTDGPVAQRRSAGMVGIASRSTGACSSPAFLPAMFRLDSRLKVFLHREAVDIQLSRISTVRHLMNAASSPSDGVQRSLRFHSRGISPFPDARVQRSFVAAT